MVCEASAKIGAHQKRAMQNHSSKLKVKICNHFNGMTE